MMHDLWGRHAGEDAWVIGSGATLDFLDSAFFANRLTIGVNEVALRWVPTRYTVTKYHDVALRTAIAYPDSIVAVSRFQHGNLDEREATELPANVVAFDHRHNRGMDFDAAADWPSGATELVVSWSTITSAMHFAAFLGAATIILVGHDCGRLNGQAHVAGYPPTTNPTAWLPARDEDDWLRMIEADSIAVRRQLEKRYGVRVYSLSPFLNYGLDGNVYERGSRVAA